MRRTTVGVAMLVAVGLLAAPVAAQDEAAEAWAVLEEYFRAWNDADNSVIAKISNFPRVSLGSNGLVVVRENPEEIAIDFEALRKAEGWDHSTLDLVDAVQASGEKVHFRVVVSRRRADGMAYRTVPALYVVTKQNGHWGLQLQSILPATFSR